MHIIQVRVETLVHWRISDRLIFCFSDNRMLLFLSGDQPTSSKIPRIRCSRDTIGCFDYSTKERLKYPMLETYVHSYTTSTMHTYIYIRTTHAKIRKFVPNSYPPLAKQIRIDLFFNFSVFGLENETLDT